MPDAPTSPPPPPPPPILSDEQYQVVHARQLSHSSLMWQVPALNLAVQAFLFSVVFGDGVSKLGGVLASVLAVVASVASLHLLAKHRSFEVHDSRLLKSYEQHKGWVVVHGRRTHEAGNLVWKWFLNISAFRVWLAASGIFLLGGVAALYLSLSALCAS